MRLAILALLGVVSAVKIRNIEKGKDKLDYMFEHCDFNENNLISYDEVAMCMVEGIKQEIRKHWPKDADGKLLELSKDEIRQMHGGMEGKKEGHNKPEGKHDNNGYHDRPKPKDIAEHIFK